MAEIEWYTLLPQRLLKSAFHCEGSAGLELAWPKEDALKVVSFLENNDYVVFGIDTWLPTVPGPTPLTYDWAPNTNTMPNTASKFIEQFTTLHPLKPGQTAVFNIWTKHS